VKDSSAEKAISINSIRNAIKELSVWRKSNDSQASMHLTHILAIKYAGVKPGEEIEYTEQDVDFKFCDKFLKVNETDKPYFDPLDMSHRIKTHPHSNVATTRKKTFSDSWKAGSFSEAGDKVFFKLNENYLSILTNKLAKKGKYTQINPSSLAIWLYREQRFRAEFTCEDLVIKMKNDFHFDDTEWNTLFIQDSPIIINDSLWDFNANKNDTSLIVDILSRDVEGFDMYHSLMAIKEVNCMPIKTAGEIVEIIQNMNCRQLILQGPPGTGKTRVAKEVAEALVGENFDESRSNLGDIEDKGSWGILQFHPSYSYEDFIQRVVPKQEKGNITIETKDMAFLTACRLAKEVAPKPFVLIIDEMNRADLQKVFGELMYALEYRNENITPQYSSNPIMVPDNLYIIGTMNTADSSVVQVDYAIRRRFVFLDILPDQQIIKQVVEDEKTRKVAIELFNATNMACEHHPRFSIGHSYFLKSNLQDLIYSYVYQVLPVLRAYQENGVISDGATIHLPGWDSDPITPWQERTDVIIECLLTWASNYE